jgi:hypothetical protein
MQCYEVCGDGALEKVQLLTSSVCEMKEQPREICVKFGRPKHKWEDIKIILKWCGQH